MITAEDIIWNFNFDLNKCGFNDVEKAEEIELEYVNDANQYLTCNELSNTLSEIAVIMSNFKQNC
ncbi:MAG: hypothetical protein WC979_02525 [Candidatus Pacearchaeota archaeon]|jgi:hypothetical protein|nr:hypothetical protein [Clostridia bacterium]